MGGGDKFVGIEEQAVKIDNILLHVSGTGAMGRDLLGAKTACRSSFLIYMAMTA